MAEKVLRVGVLGQGRSSYGIRVNGARRVITLEQVRRQIAVMEACHRQNPMPRMKRRFLQAGRPRKIAAV
ncbi:MAG: hypothetical protein WCI17_07565 [bacterium]